jgi:hypothetical protein
MLTPPLTSMDTMRNSSPLSNVTSKLPQVPHMRIGMSSVVSPGTPGTRPWRDLFDHQLASLEVGGFGQQLPPELQGVGHHLAEMTDPDRHLRHGAAVGPLHRRAQNGVAKGELMHGVPFRIEHIHPEPTARAGAEGAE